MFDLSEKLIESIRLALRPTVLQPAPVYAFGGCSGSCEGACVNGCQTTCQETCTAWKANVPK